MGGKPICSRCGCEVTKPFTATVFDEDGKEMVVKNSIVGPSAKRCVVIYAHNHCRWNAARRAEANLREQEIRAIKKTECPNPIKNKDYFLHGYRVRMKGEHIMFILPFDPSGGKN